MTKAKIPHTHTGVAPKSKVEILRDRAIKKHAKHPERIVEIEGIVREFRNQELRGGILDWSAELERLSRTLQRVGTPNPRPPKGRGIKRGPVDKTVPHRVPHAQTPSNPGKAKPKAGRKRTLSKKRIM